MTASQWLLSDKHPKLLPTPWLSPYEFEEFVERLLRAQRYLGAEVRHVATVERWGTTGDKQDGIDLAGEYSDGTRAAWQCKHLDKLRPFEVKAAVEEVTYVQAEEFCLVFARVASMQARVETKKHAGWSLMDRGQLTAMLLDLPAQIQPDIIDQTWGEDVRRLFLHAPGDDFVSIEKFALARRNPRAVLNDLGPLVGRVDELAALEAALAQGSDGFRQLVVVSGPVGRGKSRLVTEALLALHERKPGILVACLSAGHRFHAAALAELRMGPLAVLVDDAHIDPAALTPLLAFARERAEVQLVLSTRDSAKVSIINQAVLAQFGLSEIAMVGVGRLASQQARQLVKTLTEGLRLPFPLQHYLAVQAEHSPFVSVITANLIKRGELTSSLAVDDGLRTQILSRYQELLGTEVDGFPTETTQKVIATYTAIGPVPAQDRTLRDQIAAFCGLTPLRLAQLLKALGDRGVVTQNGGGLSVVPDVLADHVLEITAAFEDYDSGFVTHLWDTFGTEHHLRLALSIGELDWRLAQRDGPRVMENVWKAVRIRLQTPFLRRLMNELSQLEQLAATQPGAVVASLEELRARLDRDDVEGVEPPEDEQDSPYRRLYGRAPLCRDDVRARMPNLYAKAALHDSSQLEAALDALWALHQRKPRDASTGTKSAPQQVTDRIASLTTLRDESFPQRIVTRIAGWLQVPGYAENAATPLFMLRPLLPKEGLETFQPGIRELEFQTHTVDPAQVRNIRNQIRGILREQALADNLRHAGEALDLLRVALQPPHGYFNQAIDNGTILQWEDDDLATLETLRQIADATTVPAVRRRIRQHITWNAEHAVSQRIQHSALSLLAQLDNTSTLADEAADELWNSRFGLTVMKERHVPSPAELAAQRSAEQVRLDGMTSEEQRADREARAREKVEDRTALRNEHLAALAHRLLSPGDIPAMLDLLDQTARNVLALGNDRQVTLWRLWLELADQSPPQLEPIIHDIAARQPGPLDQGLAPLLTRWLEHALSVATKWIQENLTSGRREVKLAFANGFSGQRWHLLGDAFAEIWAAGINDPNPEIAQAYLAGAGTYLNAQPTAAVEILLEHNINQSSATNVIEEASNLDGRTYGASLNAGNAIAVLGLLSRADDHPHTVQETLTGIAASHPRLVLDHLAERAKHNGVLPDSFYELNSAYDTHADILASWIHDNLSTSHVELVVAAILNDHLASNQAASLARVIH